MNRQAPTRNVRGVRQRCRDSLTRMAMLLSPEVVLMKRCLHCLAVVLLTLLASCGGGGGSSGTSTSATPSGPPPPPAGPVIPGAGKRVEESDSAVTLTG